MTRESIWRFINPLAIIREIDQHRAILWQFTRRNIDVKHKGSYLGIIWIILTPLIQMAIYTFVFGIIFQGRYKGVPEHSTIDYALGIFLSLSIFNLIADVINVAPSIIVANPNYVKKVVFPLEILPVAAVGSSLYHFFISLCMVFVGIFFIGHGLSYKALLFPVIVFPVVILSLGLGWLFSALGVFFRDLQQVVQPLTLIIMYSSAIFFSVAMIPANFWVFLRFNPIIHVVDQARSVLLWDMAVQWNYIMYSYIFSILIFVFGFIIFKKLQGAFADVL